MKQISTFIRENKKIKELIIKSHNIEENDENFLIVINSMKQNHSLMKFELFKIFENQMKINLILQRNQHNYSYNQSFFKKIEEIKELLDCQFYFKQKSK